MENAAGAPSVLLDALIRAALIPRLRAKYQSENPRIVDEMVVWGGTVRVDVAVVGDQLRGYEIKSDADTVRRLPNQVKYYSEAFDEMTLVVGEKLQHKAVALIPEWWAVTVVSYDAGAASFHDLRPGAANPVLKPLMLARYLWKAESLSILEKHGLAKGFRSARSYLLQKRVASELPVDLLRQELLICLKARDPDWHRAKHSA